MRIAILAAGSRGDYQPALAVAQGLQRHGHEVGITATSEFVGLVRGAGVAVEEIAADVMGHYRDHLVDRGMPVGLKGQLAMLSEVAVLMAPLVRQTLADLWPRYDGIVTTAMSAAWPGLVGGLSRKPQVLMMFVPALASLHGDTSLYAVREGRSVQNLLAGLGSMRASASMVAPGADAFSDTGTAAPTRMERGQALWRMMTGPAFVANTPQIVTPRRIGGRQVRCAGYPFLDVPDGTTLPAELEQFLSAGEPPVYVGLGSHTVPAVREALRHTVAAVTDAGQRVVVMRGSGLEGEMSADNGVLFVDDVPHELLFPRTSAVVHHGGAGTTAQALRAGRPQVVLPFTMDQPFFGRRVHEIGVGAPPVPTPEASRPRLRAALASAMAPSVVERAAHVGELVRAEHGVAGCVAEIERALVRGAPRPRV